MMYLSSKIILWKINFNIIHKIKNNFIKLTKLTIILIVINNKLIKIIITLRSNTSNNFLKINIIITIKIYIKILNKIFSFLKILNQLLNNLIKVDQIIK
jgi:replicative superfamily II helicase